MLGYQEEPGARRVVAGPAGLRAGPARFGDLTPYSTVSTIFVTYLALRALSSECTAWTRFMVRRERNANSANFEFFCQTHCRKKITGQMRVARERQSVFRTT